MDAQAMVNRILQILVEENRLMLASDLGLNDQAYIELLETMVELELITDTSQSTQITPDGEKIYTLSRVVGW